ncbi:MAG: hypothetical protein OES24_08530 [Acidimicrobiia bacterium]|nr:hypothetical protein [Acidimicrobiia bacterium]
MSGAALETVSLDTVAPLHGITTWFHVFIYSASEAVEEFEQVGLEGRSGYFASRAAPMGPVPPEVITATFYNFPTISSSTGCGTGGTRSRRPRPRPPGGGPSAGF